MTALDIFLQEALTVGADGFRPKPPAKTTTKTRKRTRILPLVVEVAVRLSPGVSTIIGDSSAALHSAAGYWTRKWRLVHDWRILIWRRELKWRAKVLRCWVGS